MEAIREIIDQFPREGFAMVIRMGEMPIALPVVQGKIITPSFELSAVTEIQLAGAETSVGGGKSVSDPFSGEWVMMLTTPPRASEP